jgi:hypothetical protein
MSRLEFTDASHEFRCQCFFDITVHFTPIDHGYGHFSPAFITLDDDDAAEQIKDLLHGNTFWGTPLPRATPPYTLSPLGQG